MIIIVMHFFNSYFLIVTIKKNEFRCIRTKHDVSRLKDNKLKGFTLSRMK